MTNTNKTGEGEKFTINAMMDNDMMKMLKKWGYIGALKDGYLKCPCGATITEDNLAGIRSRNKKVVFYHDIICLTNL